MENTKEPQKIAGIETRSLRQAALMLGLDAGHFSRILSGKRPLSVSVALAIAVSLNLSVDQEKDLLVYAVTEELLTRVRTIQARLEASQIIESGSKAAAASLLAELNEKISQARNSTAGILKQISGNSALSKL